MNRKPILWAVIVLAVGFVVFRTQRNARREMEQERGFVEIIERTEGGHEEHHTRVIALTPLSPAPTDRIDWFASAYSDPSKPPFVVTFRRVLVPLETWKAAGKKPAALVADGKRYALNPYQAVADEGEESPVMVRLSGPRSILEAIAGAKSAEIEFGGKVRDLGERGLANCRELLKRSEGTAKERRPLVPIRN